MNNLIFLTTRDFSIDVAPKGKILVNNQKGIMFCLFHADPAKCGYCAETIPEFKKLSMKMAGIKFGFCNFNRDKDVWVMSKSTFSPIDQVPYIVLYVNGRPLMRYDGEQRTDVMMKFLNDVISRLNTKKDFYENKNFKFESDMPTFANTPQFNVVCDTEKGVCYLDSGLAYGKKI
jgi:thioredoxin-like negative regulator of GroEL